MTHQPTSRHIIAPTPATPHRDAILLPPSFKLRVIYYLGLTCMGDTASSVVKSTSAIGTTPYGAVPRDSLVTITYEAPQLEERASGRTRRRLSPLAENQGIAAYGGCLRDSRTASLCRALQLVSVSSTSSPAAGCHGNNEFSSEKTRGGDG